MLKQLKPAASLTKPQALPILIASKDSFAVHILEQIKPPAGIKPAAGIKAVRPPSTRLGRWIMLHDN